MPAPPSPNPASRAALDRAVVALHQGLAADQPPAQLAGLVLRWGRARTAVLAENAALQAQDAAVQAQDAAAGLPGADPTAGPDPLPLAVVLGPGPGWEATLADLRAQGGVDEVFAVGPAADQPGLRRLDLPDGAHAPGAVFLAGCAQATAPVVAWAPAGARMAPDRLERQLRALLQTGDAAALSWQGPARPGHLRLTPALCFTGEAALASVVLRRALLPPTAGLYPHAQGLPLALAVQLALSTTGAVTVVTAPLVSDPPAPPDGPAAAALAACAAALETVARAPESALKRDVLEAIFARSLRVLRAGATGGQP